jgi:hypothetical protein
MTGQARKLRRMLMALVVPTLAFYVGAVLAAAVTSNTSIDVGRLLVSAPFYLALVGAPSLLAVWTAPLRGTLPTLVTMTLVAAVAGWLVAATDDAQAGLAVLLVPYVALPLAVLFSSGRLVATLWRRRDTEVTRT